MPLTVHIVNTPLAGARDAYLDAWRVIDTRGLQHPHGRQLHMAWTVDDVLHVVDVWNSPEQQQAFMRDLGPILDMFEIPLPGAPEIGEFLQVVQPPA